MSYFFRIRRHRSSPSEQASQLPPVVIQEASAPQVSVPSPSFLQFSDYGRALLMQTGQFRIEQLFANLGSDDSSPASRSTTPTPR